MNTAVVRQEPKTQIAAGGEVLAIIPKTLDEVWRLSTAIASAPGMAPRGMEKPEQIMVAIMAGSELGMPPFQSLQSFAVVNGRPTLWGDGLMAVVKARGVKVREWFEGEGSDDMTAFCEVTRPDNGEVTLGSFSIGDAKRAGLWAKQGPWQQYPKRMLKMRARVALRDGCADMLRGFQIREEAEDFAPIRASVSQPTGLAARLSAPREPATEGFSAHHAHEASPDAAEASFTERSDRVLEGHVIPAHDQDTGEVTDADDFPGDARGPLPEGLKTGAQLKAEQAPKPTLADRVEAAKAKLSTAKTTADFTRYWGNTGQLRTDLDAQDPESLAAFEAWARERADAIAEAEAA